MLHTSVLRPPEPRSVWGVVLMLPAPQQNQATYPVLAWPKLSAWRSRRYGAAVHDG
jgi:hypothetical protein